MFFVSGFGLGQAQQDQAFLAGAVVGQFAVDGAFGDFIGQVLAPAFDLGRGRGGGWCLVRHTLILVRRSWPWLAM